MKQQDLVWVRLPFSDSKESKARPAVVVSNDDYNRNNRDVVVCAVTSNTEPKPYSVLISQENLSSGELPVNSKIRADKILQIEKSLVAASFARINNAAFDSVVGELAKLVKRESPARA